MTKSPDDHIDPYETRLTRRVGAFAEQGVRPIDPMAVAAAAHAGARRQTLAGRLFGSTASMARLGVVLAGALVGAIALGVALGAGGNTSPTATGPDATPTNAPGAAAACAAGALTGGITAWEGAAGHRIATVVILNSGSVGCSVPTLLRPALVDADGHALIVGPPAQSSAGIILEVGGTATGLVDMANYCGAAPTAQLRIRFYLPSEDSFEATDKTRGRDTIDPPPCNGPNVPSQIEMQALQLGGATN